MNQWGERQAQLLDRLAGASILGLRSAEVETPLSRTMYASSMVIAVVNPQAAEVSRKFYNKDPKALTFQDLIAVAGKELGPISLRQHGGCELGN